MRTMFTEEQVVYYTRIVRNTTKISLSSCFTEQKLGHKDLFPFARYPQLKRLLLMKKLAEVLLHFRSKT